MKRTLCPQNAHLFIWTGEQVYKLLIDWLGFYSMLNTNVTREKESLLVFNYRSTLVYPPAVNPPKLHGRNSLSHKTTR